MRFWRISNHADLSGVGGLRAAARWHNRGRPIVYLAESPPGALIEILVHLEFSSPASLPRGYRLLAVETDDDIPIADHPALPADWASRADQTRAIGDNWLAHGATALFRAPSAIMPCVYNILLNPLHPDAAKIRITGAWEAPFDARLFKKTPERPT